MNAINNRKPQFSSSAFFLLIVTLLIGTTSNTRAKDDIVLRYRSCDSPQETRSRLEMMEKKLEMQAAKFGITTEWNDSKLLIKDKRHRLEGIVEYSDEVVKVSASLSLGFQLFKRRIQKSVDQEFRTHFSSIH